MFIDRCGRKMLLIVSGSGCAVGLTVMGIFSYLFECGFDVSQFEWIPVASLSFVIFIASIGLIPIPYVIIAEVLPQKVSETLYFGIFHYCCYNASTLIDTTDWNNDMHDNGERLGYNNFKSIPISAGKSETVWMYVAVRVC